VNKLYKTNVSVLFAVDIMLTEHLLSEFLIRSTRHDRTLTRHTQHNTIQQ